MKTDVCIAYQVWKNHASHKSISVLVLRLIFMRPLNSENRRSSKKWKEVGTSASLASRCYNADDRIIKVSNKFENDMRCECVYCSIAACYSSS